MKPSAYLSTSLAALWGFPSRAILGAAQSQRSHHRAPRRAKHVLPALCALAALAGLGIATAPAQDPVDKRAGAAAAGQISSKNHAQWMHPIVARVPARPNAGRALVVLSSNPDIKVEADLQEDLAVMYHILDKAIDDSLGSDQPLRKAMGVNLVFAPDFSQLRNAYLEGYGAMFLFKVNFPLLPSSTKSEPQKEERQGSSAWEAARKEVFGEPADQGTASLPTVEAYSEDKVNRLQAVLLEALKNAANIRDLKPDEGVTLCVFGGTKAAPIRVWTVDDPSAAPRNDMETITVLPSGRFARAPQHGTILTIRAKKTDIDAFAKGQINLDEFRRNSRITSYEADTSADSGFVTYGSTGFAGGGFGGSTR